jgi:hypothetical protein
LNKITKYAIIIVMSNKIMPANAELVSHEFAWGAFHATPRAVEVYELDFSAGTEPRATESPDARFDYLLVAPGEAMKQFPAENTQKKVVAQGPNFVRWIGREDSPRGVIVMGAFTRSITEYKTALSDEMLSWPSYAVDGVDAQRMQARVAEAVTQRQAEELVSGLICDMGALIVADVQAQKLRQTDAYTSVSRWVNRQAGRRAQVSIDGISGDIHDLLGIRPQNVIVTDPKTQLTAGA